MSGPDTLEPGPTPPAELSRSVLANISLDLYDSPNYGYNAADFLERLRQSQAGVVTRTFKGGVNLNTQLGYHELAGNDTYVSDEMAGELATAAMETALPFELSLVSPADQPAGSLPRGRLFEVVAGQPSLDKLRQFSIDKGYPAHDLQGGHGQLLNVLLAASGLEPVELKPTDDEGFITPAEFDKAVANSKLRAVTMRTFKQNYVAKALHQQLATGQPSEYGAVIVDGRSTYNDRLDEYFLGGTYARIALSSLRQIAQHYGRPDRTSPVRDFVLKLTAG